MREEEREKQKGGRRDGERRGEERHVGSCPGGSAQYHHDQGQLREYAEGCVISDEEVTCWWMLDML
eukprot:492705-Rhodomonas_salina.1